ncbi:abl interactor family member [Holotrichia oblita]|uniref:Abl interactor family member n=1 Tax=Holotrichia oblita TaxID=644536 RepID=A0ACB9SWV2_HOLOL|nr:abl interactor family member [Holotrichia oblita]
MPQISKILLCNFESGKKLTGSPSRESGVVSDCDTMAELAALLRSEIPEGRNNLTDNHTNLERVAEYCEANYFQSENKRVALEETKNYTTQSLASVAYQINTLAYNFLQLLELQTAQLAEMESQMNHINQTVMIHKEKVARREIGVLTANKSTTRQYKIIAPANPEKPIKYVRKPIDYTILDDIGHGIRSAGTPRQKQRGSSQGSIQSISALSANSMVGPAPTTKPPTPPQVTRTGSKVSVSGGTLSKASREYRTPPAVAPPQVPSHYAPNYPIGHPRRGERGPGYSTLPLAGQHQAMSPPQVGMVHPLNVQQQHQQIQQHPQTPPPPPPPGNVMYMQDQHMNMPPPPSPLVNQEMPIPSHTISHHSMLMGQHNPGSGSQSPPLPPPPPPEEEHEDFGRPRASGVMPIVPDEEDLPGWVPKNYIEKEDIDIEPLPSNDDSGSEVDIVEYEDGPEVKNTDSTDSEDNIPLIEVLRKINIVAIYDYYADKDDELSFQESAVIYVLKKNDDGWWEGVMDGITGLFPGNYVEPCV